MAGTVATGLLGYLFHFLVSRKLSVAEYGELQSLLSIATILGVFSAALTNFVVKYSSVFAKNGDAAASREFLKILNSKIFRLSAALFILLLVLSPWIARFLHLSGPLGVIIVSVSASIGLMATSYRGTLSGWEKFSRVSLIGASGALVKLVLGFAIAVFFPSATFIVLSFIFMATSGWLLGRYFTRNFTETGNFSGTDWKQKYFSRVSLQQSVVPIFVFSLALILAGNIDIIIVKSLTSAEMTGYYGALSVLGKVVLWLNLAVVAIVLPGACASGLSGQKLNSRMVASAYGLIFFLSGAAIAAYALIPRFIISLLFGSRYVLFSGDLWLFGVMALALSLLTLESNFAYARHDFRISYVLFGTVALMAGGIYSFHADLRQIVIAIILAFALGYLASLVLNIRKREGNLAEVNYLES